MVDSLCHAMIMAIPSYVKTDCEGTGMRGVDCVQARDRDRDRAWDRDRGVNRKGVEIQVWLGCGRTKVARGWVGR